MVEFVKICVGNTRFGEQIYINQPVPLKEVTPPFSQMFDELRSHFDAYVVFNFLSFREYQKFGENLFYSLYLTESYFHFQKINESGLLETMKDELNIKTVFDLQNYGKTLVAAEFIDA